MQFTWQCGQRRDIRHSCSAILHFRCFLAAMYHLSDSELVTSPAVLPVKVLSLWLTGEFLVILQNTGRDVCACVCGGDFFWVK